MEAPTVEGGGGRTEAMEWRWHDDIYCELVSLSPAKALMRSDDLT